MLIHRIEDIAIALITFAKLAVWLLAVFVLATAILSPEAVGSWYTNMWLGAINTTLNNLNTQ